MNGVPCATIIGILTYVMVCTRTNITHGISIVSYFFSNWEQNIKKL